MTSDQNYFAYMVQCSDGTLYTGWTNDVSRRVEVHNLGKGAKYTRIRRPVTLVASWAFDSKREAMSMEYRIKRLPKKKKEELIREGLVH